jgi:magnesium transporter
MVEENRGSEIDELEALIQPGREDDLRTFLLLLHPVDVADLIREVEPNTWAPILKHLQPENAATLLSELDPTEQEDFLKQINRKALGGILDEMETDDLADLLQELPKETATEVFKQIPSEEQEEVRELMAYDPESAGGIMQTELVSVPEKATIQEAIEIVRKAREEVDPIITIFVVDDKGRYVGNLGFQNLVFSPPMTAVADVMEPRIAEVMTDLDQEEVARIFDRYSLVEVGVIDRAGILRGRITADDVHEVLLEEAEEDMMVVAGAPPAEPEKVYTGSALTVAGMRMPWLISTFCGGLLASVILQRADSVLSQVVLLTFVPVITGMSGNVGSQSAMIMIRGMATGHIVPGDIVRNVMRDLSIALIIAAVCGVIVTCLVSIWHGSPMIGLCVGVSLAVSMTTASILGSAEPPILERFGIDPTIAAGPLITTINDVTGVLIYSFVARVFLSQMS